jgi:hypothetical protein
MGFPAPDGLHVAAVHSKDELVSRPDDSHEPLSVGRECDRQRGAEASGFRQDTHESNDVAAYQLGSKRILYLQADQIATIAENNFRLEWQLSEQCSAEFGLRAGLTNDKCTSSSDIHDAIGA